MQNIKNLYDKVLFSRVACLPFETRILSAVCRLPTAAFASGSGIYGVNLFNIMNTAEQSQPAREVSQPATGNPA